MSQKEREDLDRNLPPWFMSRQSSIKIAYRLVIAIITAILLLGGMALVVYAAVTTRTNTTDAMVDGATITRTVTFMGGDFPAGATIEDVNIEIDFAKISSDGACGPPPTAGSGSPYNSEILFTLTSLAGSVVLVEDGSNSGGSGASATYTDAATFGDLPATVTFDDSAATAVGGSAPISGTFRPVQSLSFFNGGSPFGIWTLTIGDSTSSDPLCFYEFRLTIDVGLPDLSITKTLTPVTAIPGQSITYTIAFSNAGPGIAAGVVITDTIPVSLTVQSVISSGVVITDTGFSPAHVWNVQDLALGEGGIITISGILSSPLAAGIFTNTATITATEVETDTTDNGSSAGVTISNVAPIAADDPGNTDEDTPATINVLINDSDTNGDTLFISGAGIPANGSAAISGTTQIVYTPTLNFNGTDVLTYTVSDSVYTDTATITVTVNAVNDLPTVANPVPDQNATEDTAFSYTFPANTFDDVDAGDSLTYTTALTGGSALPGWLSFDAGARNYSGTPLNADVGTLTLVLTATDTSIVAVGDTFVLTITDTNDPPTLATPIPDQTAAEDAAFSYTFPSNTFNDVDAGDSLTYTTTLTGGSALPGWLSFDAGARNYSGTPLNADVGTLTLVLTATDTSSAAVADTFVLTVTNTNDPPTFSSTPVTSAAEDITYTYAVTASDVDVGDILTISASITPAWLDFSDATDTLSGVPATSDIGDHAVSLQVEDTAGMTATQTFTITVADSNDTPSAVDDLIITDEDTPVSIHVLDNDTDPDDDTLSIEAVGIPNNGIVAIFNLSSLVYTPTLDFYGDDVFTYTVSDGVLSDTGTITVTVRSVNDPPSAANDAITTTEDSAVSIAVLGNDGDLEGDSLFVSGVGSAANGALTTDGVEIVYTPNADFNGSDSFTYTVGDSGGATDVGTVSVTVTAVNDRPDAINDAATTGEETPVSILVLDNDSDPENDPLSISSAGSPAHGVVTISNTQYLVYTPSTDYYGSDSLNYTISDGNGGQDTATVVVTVDPLNDAPLAVNDAAFTDADTSIVIDLLANDSDVDGDSLSIVSVTQGSNGRVSDNGDGSVVYAPDNGFSGLDAFSYTISDGAGGSDQANVTVIVAGGESTVTANDDIVTTAEDTPTAIAVLDNDYASDSSPLLILGVTPAQHGVVAISNTQYLIYTPHADYYGPDTFTYIAGDGAQSADTAVVSLYVDPVNDNPDAVDDAAATDEDTAVDINVLDNDSDVDGDTIHVTGLGEPAHGSVRLLPGGGLRYTPAANYNGIDSFTYSAGDGQGGEDSATVQVNVGPVNDAPALVDDTVTTDEDTPVDINVLANDGDLEGDPLTVTLLGTARNGTVVTNTDGTIRYTPDADYNGQDDFSYTTEDGNGGSNSAMVTVIIKPVDDPPEGVRDATIVIPQSTYKLMATTATTTEVELDVLSNDVNKDEAQLEVARVGRARNGRVSIGQNGKIKYIPDAGFSQGTDVFTYVVGAVGTTYESIDQVSIVYNPDSGDVVAVDDAITTDEDTPVTFVILDNDQNNVVTTSLSLMGIIPGDKGLIVPNPDDTLTYYPAKNLNGTDVFTYIVGNGEMGGDYGEVTITINPVNDPPDAIADVITTTQGVSVTFDALANDEDVDGDTLHIAGVIPSGNGSVTINPDDTLTHKANPDFWGVDLFALVVRDEHGRDDIGLAAVIVVPINHAPEGGVDLATIVEDTVITLSVLLNDYDEDGDVLTVTQITQPSFGTASLNDDNTVTYTPEADATGADSFSYTVSDGDMSGSGEVRLTITPVNDAPNAVNDTVNTPTGAARLIFVLGNDVDPEGDPISISAVGAPAHGSVTIPDPQSPTFLLYTPTLGFSGADTFTYTVSDGELVQTGAVTVTVGVSNTAPTPSDDAVVTAEDNAITVAALADDSDPDGDPLVVVGVCPATNGIVTISNNRYLVYRPDPDFYGSDTFTYTVSDGDLTATAVVAVTVTPLDDPPTAVDDHAATAKNTPVVIDVLLNDVDVDGDRVNVKALGSASHGLVTLPPDPGYPLKSKKVTYTPAQDFVGTDVFTYTATDGAFDDTATVSVTVRSSGLIITKSTSTIYGTVQLPVLPGSFVTYTIQLAHAGGDAAQSVTMFDILPAAVRFNEWIEGEEWGTLLLPDTILWGPHDVAADTVVVLRFTAVVTTNQDFYGQTVVNVAQYSSDNAGYGSDDASFEIEVAPSAGISFVSPSAGQLFTATNNVSATVPITVATTNFSLPDDGHWQLWVDGNDLGTVYGYTATVTLGLGTRVISAELRDLAHAPLGPVATVTVTVEPRVPFIYLPLVLRNRP